MSSHNLPPGFRFHPTDEELIFHYLKKKVSSPSTPLVSIIADIDLYKLNPWELPGTCNFSHLFSCISWPGYLWMCIYTCVHALAGWKTIFEKILLEIKVFENEISGVDSSWCEYARVSYT